MDPVSRVLVKYGLPIVPDKTKFANSIPCSSARRGVTDVRWEREKYSVLNIHAKAALGVMFSESSIRFVGIEINNDEFENYRLYFFFKDGKITCRYCKTYITLPDAVAILDQQLNRMI